MTRPALVVEDEAPAAEFLVEFLRRRGCQPTVFTRAAGVVDWVRTHLPELVLLDLILPDGDGNDVCEQLKLDRKTNLIPVVMVTACDRVEDRARGLQVGANAYLSKPFTYDQLQSAVDLALSWREHLRKHGTAGEVRFHLRSHTRHLEDLNTLLASLLHFTCLEPDQVRQLVTAVREMGTNAIEWGHRNQVDRIVAVTYRIEPTKVTIVIADTGPGFDPERLPHAARDDDPIGHLDVRAELGLREGGFGIMMARGLVDELHFNEVGNEVTLVKKCAPPEGAGAQCNRGLPE